MGPIGLPELLLIGAVALIVFGPARLPELGRSLGRAMREFRSAVRSLDDGDEDASPARGTAGGTATAGKGSTAAARTAGAGAGVQPAEGAPAGEPSRQEPAG